MGKVGGVALHCAAIGALAGGNHQHGSRLLCRAGQLEGAGLRPARGLDVGKCRGLPPRQRRSRLPRLHAGHRNRKGSATGITAQQGQLCHAATQWHAAFGLIGLAGQQGRERGALWPNVAPVEGRVAGAQQGEAGGYKKGGA